MSATASHPNYSPGLEGIIAGVSTISEIDSERSSLQYRGVDVHDLAEKGSFEETLASYSAGIDFVAGKSHSGVTSQPYKR